MTRPRSPSPSFLPLSASRLKGFLNCPRSFRYRYLDGLPEAFLSVEAFAGRLVHQVIESLGAGAERGDPPPRLMAVLEDLERRWARGMRGKQEIRVVRGDHPRKYLARAARAMEAYYWENHPFRSKGKEKRELEILFQIAEGIPVRGFIDRFVVLEDGSVEIHDYKTGARSPRKALAQGLGGDLQGGLYHLGASILHPGARITCHWHFLLHRKTVTAQITTEEAEAIRAKALAIHAAILCSGWEARPSPLCLWCGYNGICPEGEAHLRG